METTPDPRTTWAARARLFTRPTLREVLHDAARDTQSHTLCYRLHSLARQTTRTYYALYNRNAR